MAENVIETVQESSQISRLIPKAKKRRIMSESEPDIKDVFDKERAPKQTDNVSDTEPVFKALQEVKSQTGNTTTENSLTERNSLRNDSGHQSTESFIKSVKERCETLQIISDRSTLGLMAKSDKSTVSELQILLVTYRKGLANLLLGKCYYEIIQGEYGKVYCYANELANVAQKLPSSEFLQFATSLMSTEFVKDKLAGRQARLLKEYLEVSLDNRSFIDKLTRNKLAYEEYKLLRALFRAHMLQCDFQFCVDLCNKLLEITCMLRDRELIINMIAEFANLYLVLGKYWLSYNVMKEMQSLKIEGPRTQYIVVCNFSVVELLLNKKQESLKHAKDSLPLAQRTKDLGYIACAHGNIGLAYEYMGRYEEAIEPYKECLRLGQEAGDYRVINNGLCNLGRAYLGLGNIEEAKKHFKEAIEAPRPPKAYWCDTEDFRFSGDYLLAKLLLEEKNLDEAAEQFMKVIKRCETLRKRIKDSPIKITFNDTQRKPFQYLQHVMLENGEKMKALAIAEKGRGRDYFDKIEDEFFKQLDSEEFILDVIKSQGIAVLFISTLEEVGKLCLWFISSEGKLLKQCSIPYIKCKDIFDKLCPVLHKTQEKLDIEFRGTNEEDYSLVERAFRIINHDLSRNNDADSTNTLGSFKNSSLLDTTGAKTTNKGECFFRNTSREQTVPCTKEERCSLPGLIEKLSELIVSPFQVELESLTNKATTGNKPRLLVIPQGTTFNIPFSALKLNGEPLCNHVTIIEAFSFNSFAYATTESQKRTPTGNFQNALIVGNPTHKDDLPKAEEESKAIATRLGVTPLLRGQATKKAIVDQLPNANLIHFACHGEMGGKGLLLACENPTSHEDYHLTTGDVESLQLDADLVVLSACHTARGTINSEGVVGLARAFQIAGARSIVTALWAIPDRATQFFMEHFYGNLGDGLAVADAIRATQVKMQENKDFNEVINWGSFKVFGANGKIM